MHISTSKLRGSRIAMPSIAAAAALAASLAPLRAHGQLAITEVMSFAASSHDGSVVPALADFWELTNFGTNAIDLTGYTWNDNSGGLANDDEHLLHGLILGSQETVIFVQSEPPNSTNTAQEFRDWWGSALPAEVRIFLYAPNGFGQAGDGIRLWAPDETDAAAVVDQVDFGEATRGRSFTYDPATGRFGMLSTPGTNGAFKAATRDDVGSPGNTTGPVPLHFLTQPDPVTVCAGIDATFTAVAGGLPRPRYRWFRDGVVIPGATAARHTVSNPQAADAGTYHVEISNGFEIKQSQPATLAVENLPTPPVLLSPLEDVLAVSNDTVRFTAVVCAFPAPTYQWHADGVPIVGATHRSLELPAVQFHLSGTTYCLQISNQLGATSTCARLIVAPKPALAITEVMPSSSIGCGTNADWFELTNCGTDPVDLKGYRWATGNNRSPSLDEPRVVTNQAILLPGQSAIFVERLNRTEFFRWWGPERLPPDLMVITYAGEGLNQFGDELYLWSPRATDPNDPVTSCSWAAATIGVSRHYREKGFDALDEDSIAGELGAFPAEECGDVGSPGYRLNPPPRLVGILRNGPQTIVRARVVPGRSYHLRWKQTLTDPAWMPLSTHRTTHWVDSFTDATAAHTAQRFYLLEEAP